MSDVSVKSPSGGTLALSRTKQFHKRPGIKTTESNLQVTILGASAKHSTSLRTVVLACSHWGDAKQQIGRWRSGDFQFRLGRSAASTNSAEHRSVMHTPSVQDPEFWRGRAIEARAV